MFTVFTDVAEVKIEVAARAQACRYELKDIHIIYIYDIYIHMYMRVKSILLLKFVAKRY